MASAARILDTGGLLDTNRVAAIAGVSVGTLYQYFPNKEAILGGLVERLIEQKTALVRERIHESFAETLSEKIDLAIAALVESKRRPDRMEDLAIEFFLRYADVATLKAVDERLCQVVADALRGAPHETRELDVDMAAFILVQATRGVLVTARLERSDLLLDEHFARELGLLVKRYLGVTA